MAEPSGPTVAKDPDELGPSTSAGADHGTIEPGDVSGAAGRAPDDPGAMASPTPADADDEPLTEADLADASTTEAATTVADPEPPVEERSPAPGPVDAGAEADEAPVEAAKATGRDRAASGDADLDEATDADGSDDGELEDDDELDDDERPRRGGGLLTKQVQVDARMILIVVALLAVMVGAYLFGQRDARNDGATGSTTPTTKATTPSTMFKMPSEFVPFEDKDTGVKLSIPKEWQQRSTMNLGPATRLFLEVPDSQDTVILRVNSYAREVTEANLGDQKVLVDSLFAAEKITILGFESGVLQGMPVLIYIYPFTEPGGATGIHAHYFFFQGRKAVQLVFQALPAEHYSSGGLGAVWTRISETVEVTKDPPPAFLEQLGAPATTVPAVTILPTTVP